MKDKFTLTEQNILQQAVEALEQNTGLVLAIQPTETPPGDGVADAILRLGPDGGQLVAEVKKWAQQANLGVLMNLIRNIPGEGILIADYINPNMAEKLRHENIQFIDTRGNAYINQPPIYVYVNRHKLNASKLRVKTLPDMMKTPTTRAFEQKGLMVTYAFLCQPELVNAAYRDIAKITDVAVGTVNKVIDALKAADFIRETGINKKHRRLINHEKLLDRWIEFWPDKLKTKLYVGEFAAMDPYWRKDVDMEEYGGYWGGEIAGAMYTDYLKPEVATVYLPRGNLTEFLMDMRLRKATEWNENAQGRVMVYHTFWDERLDMFEPVQKPGIVHPILAYADLVATGDTRNLEVARMIYDKYIAEYYRED